MKHKKRFGNSEINLTPLLDVLFSILFIVMLGSAGNEAKTKAEADKRINRMRTEAENAEKEAARESEGLKQRIDELQKENRTVQKRLEDYELYERDGVVVSVINTTDEAGHVLRIYLNDNGSAYDSIQLGTDLTGYTGSRIKDIITGIADGVDNMPIFIVFRCDPHLIYTREYNAVNDAFTALQEEYKEVFYKRIISD